MRACNVVWCGDSITAGNHVNPGECFPELVAATLPITSHNIGIPSATCDSGGQAATAAGLYDVTKVNICYILFGANDGIGGKTAPQFATDLASFVSTVQAAGFIAVPVTMLPCGSYDSVAFRAAINGDIRSTYTRYVDIGHTSTEMGAEAAKNDGTLYSDTVHPTALGNTKLTARFITSIQQIASDGFAGVRIMRMAS